MCLKLFTKKYEPLTIPYPEEHQDKTKTVANTDIQKVLISWLENYRVPSQYTSHWISAIDIQVYDVCPDHILSLGASSSTPAITWSADNRRHLAVLASWFNEGVVAHEQAHNSYDLLSEADKGSLPAILSRAKNEPLVSYLFQKNPYGLTNDVECHAEVYRYLGDKMPNYLKPYYPKLF